MHTFCVYHLKEGCMKTKLLRILLVWLGWLLVAVAPVWSAEPIFIGLSAPITGNYAEYGNNWKKAMDIAVERINQRGGIKGRPIQLVVEDSKSDPKDSAHCAKVRVRQPDCGRTR